MEEIKKTYDYDKFKTLTGNRIINEKHVKDLVNSFSKKDLSSIDPVIVNSGHEIIDGQHRFEALKRVKKPIYYIKANNLTLKEVQMLNTNQWSWNTDDYLKSYISRGYKDYIVLADFIDKYALSISVSLRLLDDRSDDLGNSDKPGKLMKKFKEGKFIVSNLHNAEKMAKRLDELKDYCEEGIWKNRDFIGALIRTYRKTTHERLMNRLSNYNFKVKRQITVKDYMRTLEDIVNYRVHEKNKVRLF